MIYVVIIVSLICLIAAVSKTNRLERRVLDLECRWAKFRRDHICFDRHDMPRSWENEIWPPVDDEFGLQDIQDADALERTRQRIKDDDIRRRFHYGVHFGESSAPKNKESPARTEKQNPDKIIGIAIESGDQPKKNISIKVPDPVTEKDSKTNANKPGSSLKWLDENDR